MADEIVASRRSKVRHREYMREYMRKRRAGEPVTSKRAALLEAKRALEEALKSDRLSPYSESRIRIALAKVEEAMK